MAARLSPTPFRPAGIVDLRRISSRDLSPLLDEEVAAWRRDLEWDFSKSAELVRRFVDLRALNGAAWVEDGEVAGYAYYVLEENKGLIGDLYVRASESAPEREKALLESVLEAAMASPAVVRIESQLMMLRGGAVRPETAAGNLITFDRNFMRVETAHADLSPGHVRRPCYLERWSDHYHDAAAQLISEAYAGHVDSRINDQYRTVAGARRFLHNIVQYPGCGNFYRPGSYAAFEASSGRLCGISLASLVAPDSGHITQICVSEEVRGKGVGHELLRQSLLTLRELGCRSVSLTVTASNAEAVTLYERVGFRTVRRFAAFVWEGF